MTNVETVSFEEMPFDFGPGLLTAPAVEGGEPLALASPELVPIQTYAATAIALPGNDDEFRKFVGGGAPADLSSFEALIKAWKEMKTHAKSWRDGTYPKLVALAGDISHYATLAKVYFAPVKDLAAKLTANPDDAEAKEDLAGILRQLENEARTMAGRADVVVQEVGRFETDLSNDKVTLLGLDGKSGLLKKYRDANGSKDAEVRKIEAEIDTLLSTLKTINDEYTHAVTVAATTPTYAWVSVIGTVVAVVVAGVYGDRAKKALDRFHATDAKIQSLKGEKQLILTMSTSLKVVNDSLCLVSTQIVAALNALRTVQGAWHALAQDLGKIARMVDTNIRQVAPRLMKYGVDATVARWETAGASADRFRERAFVQMTDTIPTPSSHRHFEH